MLFRHTFDDLTGFYKIGLILFLLPTGVLYFVLIDLLDIVLSVYRWLLFVVFGWSELRIQILEDTLARQMHMSRMNFLGFKVCGCKTWVPNKIYSYVWIFFCMYKLCFNRDNELPPN